MQIMRYLKVAALLAVLLPVTGQADVPLPEISKGQGDSCVRPTDDMRKNHMEYIKHHRDETMYRGIRTTQDSLKQCVTCHAVKDEQGNYVRIDDDRHFCETCHEYAAVSIDCFQCHTDTPKDSDIHEPLAKGQ
jgi:hypothetical protein